MTTLKNTLHDSNNGLDYTILSAESDRSSPDRAAPHRAVGPLT